MCHNYSASDNVMVEWTLARVPKMLFYNAASISCIWSCFQLVSSKGNHARNNCLLDDRLFTKRAYLKAYNQLSQQGKLGHTS